MMDKKIITTDEKIARFVTVNILTTINTITGSNKMRPEHIRTLKNEVKKDIKNLDECYRMFELLLNPVVSDN